DRAGVRPAGPFRASARARARESGEIFREGCMTAAVAAGETDAAVLERLAAAGLAAGEARDWLQAEPGETTDFPADRRKFSAYWQQSARLLARLPGKPRRNAAEHAAGLLIAERAPEARARFLRRPAGAGHDGAPSHRPP